MSAKHTPGPWGIFPAHDHCPEEDYPSFVIGPKQFHSVAQVRPGNIDDGLPAETPANARLIAAAPDLLDACRTMGAMILGIADAIELDVETEMKISVGGKLAKTVTLGEVVQQVTAAIGKATQP